MANNDGLSRVLLNFINVRILSDIFLINSTVGGLL